jgi:hypothetical protein
MRVSVLMPTYDQARFLPRALAGLAAQTFRDFEVIACDDGSTDGTAGILAAAPGVRTVTHDRNRGTAAAINSAAALASGDLMTWVSSDNVMHPEWLAALVGEVAPGRGAVYSAYVRIDEKGRRREVCPGPHGEHRLVSSDECYYGPSFLIRRDVWADHRGGSSHDYDSWARVEELCRARRLKIGYVDRPLCDYHAGDWNTCRVRPDLYDAPQWRREAIGRRNGQPPERLNWLGQFAAARVGVADTVLDLGCGIMPATGGRLACRRHVGVDCFRPYLDRIGPPCVLADLPGGLDGFADDSFDVVLLLDVVEHLEKPAAMTLIGEAERIAGREVILFTPDGYVEQRGWGAWDMPDNPAQAHRCGFTFDELAGMGYECTRHRNGTAQAGPIVSVLGIKATR